MGWPSDWQRRCWAAWRGMLASRRTVLTSNRGARAPCSCARWPRVDPSKVCGACGSQMPGVKLPVYHGSTWAPPACTAHQANVRHPSAPALTLTRGLRLGVLSRRRCAARSETACSPMHLQAAALCISRLQPYAQAATLCISRRGRGGGPGRGGALLPAGGARGVRAGEGLVRL